MAKTWAILNNAQPDEFFTNLRLRKSVRTDKQGNWTGKVAEEAVDSEGAIHIMRMGERVITAMKNADLRTFLHEIGHDARAMFSSKLQKDMERAIAKQLPKGSSVLDDTGRWTDEAEEAWANAFEEYTISGKAPRGSGLSKVFRDIKNWLEETFKAITGQPQLSSKVNPELKKVFDQLFVPPKPTKASKGVQGAATATANAADAVDTQVDEATTGTKPLQETQAGGETIARSEFDQQEIDRMMQQGLTEEEAIAINNRGKEAATRWSNDAEKFTQPQRVDDVSPNTAQSTIPSLEQVNQAIQKEPLGVGGNARVYNIDDSHVVRVPKHVKGEILDDFKPIDHPLTKLGIEAGQEVAENSQGVTIRQKQIGEEAGLAIPKQVPEAQRNELYKSRVIKAADMPQEAYDKLAETIKKINDAGYQIDPSKSSNILIDSDNGKFNLVDVTESKRGYKSGAEDMLVMLMGNTYAATYNKTGTPLTEQYRKIYDKVMEATKKHGLSEKLNSSGEWSRELAGGEKAPRVDLNKLVKSNKEALEKARTAKLADTVRTSADDTVVAKPNASDVPAGQADIPGQIEELSRKIKEESDALDKSGSSNYNRLNALVRERDILEKKLAQQPQSNPIADMASQAQQPELPKSNMIQDAAKVNGGRDFMTRNEDGSLNLVNGQTGEVTNIKGMRRQDVAKMDANRNAIPIIDNPLSRAASANPIAEAAGSTKSGSDMGTRSTEDLITKWIRMNKGGRGYIGTFRDVQKLSGEEMNRLQRAMEKDPRFIRDKDGGYYPTDEAIASVSKIDEERLASEAMKTLDSAQVGSTIQTYTKGSAGPNAAVDPKLAAEGFAETRNARLPAGYHSRFTARKINDDKWEVIKEDVSHKQSTPPPTSVNPLARASDTAVAPEAPMSRELPTSPDTIAKEAANDTVREVPKVPYQSVNPLLEKQKAAQGLDKPKPRGLLARAVLVDKAAAAKSAFSEDAAPKIQQTPPAPKQEFANTASNNKLPVVREAEEVFGVSLDGQGLTDIKKLPEEKASHFLKMMDSINEPALADADALKDAVREATEKAIGRAPTDDEVARVDRWLSHTDSQYQIAKKRLDASFEIFRDKLPDRLKHGSKEAKREGVSLSSILRKNGGLDKEAAAKLADDLSVTPAIFREGFEATEESVALAIKDSTGRDISTEEAQAIVASLNSKTASHQTIIKKAREAHARESIGDRNVGGASKKARAPFVGGKALEDTPLKDSVGKIDHEEVARAMQGASEEDVAKVAQSLRDLGVDVAPKIEAEFSPGMTIDNQIQDLQKQIKAIPLGEQVKLRRNLQRQVDELRAKKASSQAKVDLDDDGVKALYVRMNALKMLATKATDEATKEVLGKIAKEVKDKIVIEEMPRAQKMAQYWNRSGGVRAGLDDDVEANLMAMLIDMVDQHDFTKYPRITNTALRNRTGNAYRQAAGGTVTRRIKSVSEVINDEQEASDMLASVVRESPSQTRENLVLVQETLFDEKWMESLPENERKIAGMLREGVTDEEAAAKLGLNGGDYQMQLNAVAKKIEDKISPRMSHNKPNPPEKAAASIEKHNLARAQWSEIIKAIKGDSAKQTLLQALDVGENLFMASAPARTLFRLFDKSVYGAQSYEAQELGRKRFRAYERAIASFREILAPIAKYVGETGVFDHETIMAELVRAGRSTEEASKEAMRIINSRNDDILRFFEAKGEYNLNPSLFNQPAEKVQELQTFLGSVKELFPEMIQRELSSGLAGQQLMDEMSAFFPRSLASPEGTFSAIKSESRNKVLLDAAQDSQRARNDYFRNIRGGTATLNRMSLDPAISGIAHDEIMLGKGISKATLKKATNHIIKNYMYDVLPDNMIKNGKPTKEGRKKIQQIAASMAQLPKAHIEQQIPMFGNNFMRNIATYVEEHFTKRAIALSGQDLAINNMTVTGDQRYYLSRLFEKTNMDNHMAYMNVIKGTGRYGDYQRYIEDRFAAGIKGKHISLDDEGRIVSKSGKHTYDSLEDWAEKTMLSKRYSEKAQIGVSEEAFHAATYFLAPWSSPKELGMIKQGAAAALNLFKSMVTLPFPAFHVRNFLSGQVQNFFFGAYDPTGFGLGRYTKQIRQAWAMRNGDSIKNIHKELPKELVDEILAPFGEVDDLAKDTAVTDWLRRSVFKFGITGDKQGYAAEDIGSAISDMVSQLPGAKKKDRKNWFGMKPAIMDPTTTWLQKLNPFAFEGSAYPTISKTKEHPRGQLDAKKFDKTTFVPGAVGAEGSMMVEDVNRIAPFLAFLKQGVSPEEAARRVQAIQFDYSRLSETDKAIKQLVPFWTFTSRSTALLITDLLTNPGGKQAWSIRATNRAQDPESPIPEHVRRGVAIPLGKGADGEDRYLSGFGLAWEDPLELLSFAHGDVKASAASAFSKLRPEAQMLGEAAFGRSAFFDRDFNDLDPQLGRLRDNVLGKDTKGLAEPLAGSQALEFLVGKSPAARAVATGNKLLDNRKSGVEKLLNAASGIKITDVNAEAADRIRIQQAAEQLKELGGREVSMSYVPDWKKERMTAEELQKAQELQKMINSIKSEQRDARSRPKYSPCAKSPDQEAWSKNECLRI